MAEEKKKFNLLRVIVFIVFASLGAWFGYYLVNNIII